MGKGSQRRPCQISREEESLRWKLALGEITFHAWCAGMQELKVAKESEGVCGNCVDGLMVDCTIDYGVICRIDLKDHSRWDTCTKFREDV